VNKMEIKMEKSKLKAAELNMRMMEEDEIPDFRTMESNVIIDRLEANIESRKMPIEKRLKKNFDSMK